MSESAARGCLDESELRKLAGAAPGRVPADVAAHLASCPSCQRRALAGDAPRRAEKARVVPVQHRLLRALIVVFVILVALFTMLRLAR